jgi:hypothetical protein
MLYFPEQYIVQNWDMTFFAKIFVTRLLDVLKKPYIPNLDFILSGFSLEHSKTYYFLLK